MQGDDRNIDDENLVRNFDLDSQAAFKYLFEKYYSILCYYAENVLNDPIEAEDAVEDMFTHLWKRNTDFRQFASIKAFLYTCTLNACHDYLKRRNRLRKRLHAFSDMPEQNQKDHLNEMIRAEFLRTLVEALECLPPECGKIIKLLYVEGWRPQKIANELGISLNTVRSHRARGIVLLRQRITALPMLIYIVYHLG